MVLPYAKLYGVPAAMTRMFFRWESSSSQSRVRQSWSGGVEQRTAGAGARGGFVDRHQDRVGGAGALSSFFAYRGEMVMVRP
ncbi:hypothetical protein EC9_41420 [Rosistilla ulvae]|uniref:Uncharacterized protein n=1 Tax=Rosistilla ulvae TaxID=1930277 RepID=A0A517M4Z6_9BACT|nr:hypothetical protein EC9_41420 [Rosistilla ulvae]